MKKKYFLLSLFVAALLVTFNTAPVNSKIASPPAGSSGDPFTGASCAQGGCHPSPTQTPGPTDVTLMIGTDAGNITTPFNSNFKYKTDTTYYIQFLINSFTGRYGFQIVPLDAANTQAGVFPVPLFNAGTTKINTLSSRQYMGHLLASSTRNWIFKWTAPSITTGDITFYYAYNTADNDNTPVGDVIYKNSVTISPDFTGIADNMADKISQLIVMPNPVTDNFTMQFTLKQSDMVSASLYSLEGTRCQELINEKTGEGAFNRSFDVVSLPSGIYLLKLSVGNASVMRKMIKQ